MKEVVLGTVVIVGLTILVGIIKIDKNRSNICYFNCENCKERNVCKIKK